MHILSKSKKPLSASALHKKLVSQSYKVNLVTVYRILETFHTLGIVHQHPCDGSYSLCSLPGENGHHAFLHCTQCGKIEEVCDELLCKAEHAIAKKAHFQPIKHISELTGLCASCQS
jgi:Fur family ferric uptake transcriptional regulator